MTHELKRIIAEYLQATKSGVHCVLATVVALDGSSYRRPGVRMLLLENGRMIGAVSGGCVEKEVFRQAETVFKTGVPKVMTYDGRYRLGCEGILYILLEPMNPSNDTLERFHNALKERSSFEIISYFQKEFSEDKGFGTKLIFNDSEYSIQKDFQPNQSFESFKQVMQPCFRLVIIGAEHDTVQLSSFAAMMGWEVTIVVNPKEEKVMEDFPGATGFIPSEGDSMNLNIDGETAIVLMTHSYVKDLKYLSALKEEKPAYFGLLGPARRREKLFHELLELYPDIDYEFFESIHGPAGLDIGSETPQEISLAVLSEILAVINKKQVNSLREKEGRIHA